MLGILSKCTVDERIIGVFKIYVLVQPKSSSQGSAIHLFHTDYIYLNSMCSLFW